MDLTRIYTTNDLRTELQYIIPLRFQISLWIATNRAGHKSTEKSLIIKLTFEPQPIK